MPLLAGINCIWFAYESVAWNYRA